MPEVNTCRQADTAAEGSSAPMGGELRPGGWTCRARQGSAVAPLPPVKTFPTSIDSRPAPRKGRLGLRRRPERRGGMCRHPPVAKGYMSFVRSRRWGRRPDIGLTRELCLRPSRCHRFAEPSVRVFIPGITDLPGARMPDRAQTRPLMAASLLARSRPAAAQRVNFRADQ